MKNEIVKSEPVRIAHVIGKLNAAGVEMVINNYYKHIDRTKYQFDFIIDSDSNCEPSEEMKRLGARYYVVPPYQNLFHHMRELIRLFKENRYMIVHSGMNTLAPISLCAAWIAGTPIRINHNHSTANKSEGKRVLLKYILRPFARCFATHCLACSNHAGKWLFGERAFSKGQVTVFNNAIELERFMFNEDRRNSVRKQLKIDKDDFVIGHVGRFMPQKNHEFILRVFIEVANKHPNAKLILVGDGEKKADIHTMVEQYGLIDKVIFVGAVSNPEDYYHAMDVFLFPSIFEGLGMVAIEAQVSGLPVVTSVQVPREIEISDNVCFLDLNDKIELWCQNVMNCQRQNREADLDRITNTGYNIALEARKMEDFYTQVLKKHK